MRKKGHFVFKGAFLSFAFCAAMSLVFSNLASAAEPIELKFVSFVPLAVCRTYSRASFANIPAPLATDRNMV